MTSAQITVDIMLSKDWFPLPESVVVVAEKFAPRQVKNYSDEQRNGRDDDDLLEHARRGLIAEIWHNYLRHNVGWWRDHWTATQEEVERLRKLGLRSRGGDDKGTDDKDGNGVKVILTHQKYVSVSDNRPLKQYVYELYEQNKRIRFLGTFTRVDRQWIHWANVYGVLRDSIK